MMNYRSSILQPRGRTPQEQSTEVEEHMALWTKEGWTIIHYGVVIHPNVATISHCFIWG